MAINISQAFHRTSAAAIDDTLTLTKAEMLTVNDNLMPAKYLTVCQDDGKIYLYDKSATPSQETGKFSVFEGGGGGVSSYNDLTDKPSLNGNMLSGNKTNSQLGIPTALSEMTDDTTHRTVTDTQITTWSDKQNAITAGTNLEFDGDTLNASMSVLGTINRSDIYDTTEKVIGKWTDGRPIYQKTFIDIQNAQAVTNGTVVSKYIDVGASVQHYIAIDAIAKGPSIHAAVQPVIVGTNIVTADTIYNYTVYAYDNNGTTANKNKIELKNNFTNFNGYTLDITLLYTKTTDAANSYNYADENDYSTTEHIVGKWIDGKPLYQKTISGTVTKTSDGNEAQTRINIGVSVANVIKIDGFVKSGAATYSLNFAKFKNGNVTVLRTTANNNTSGTYPNVVTISENAFGTSDSNTYTAYVTLQYTKTTD